jgi:hypothetical protein
MPDSCGHQINVMAIALACGFCQDFLKKDASDFSIT